MSLTLGKKLLTNDVHHNTNFSSSLLSREVWLVPPTSVFSPTSQAFAGLWAQGRTFSSLKPDSLESCCWAPPLSSPCLCVFWTPCASHTDLFLIYTLCFPGWLIFSFTWNTVHTMRAVFATLWNPLCFPSYSCFTLQLGETVLHL